MTATTIFISSYRVQAGQQEQQEQYDPYRPNPHASWLSQASAIDPFGTAAAYNYATQPHRASAAVPSVERPPTTVIRESAYNNLHHQGSATGARASGITATTDASSVNNDSSTINTTDEFKQQRPQHIQTDSDVNSNNNEGRMLWDDALASAGGSTVARSASTASTNPFRSSMSNPRGSAISALRIPPIPRRCSVFRRPCRHVQNNNTSPIMKQQHHHNTMSI
ncbi:hypothetical protein BDB00DRAFT_897623 [Zychaea mexicana]|uniref:uncharacterized protein n=1 Tax=Zychaea mexicana TaxID=64656 RepID=UPI0022FE9A05|nr:uncharacterized protein BDB00DRAFT_897623 [Zychaea mexicana]KAI9495738.1 hypothetical protein BDB00DRAFT_897623 [Zychaea mexicana]